MTDDATLPRHVAFIMDGNGRWAEERGLPRALGHQAGAETVRRVTEFCRRRGIPFLTLYAFSTENWTRPQEEVDALMALLAAYVERELPELRKNDIRLRIIGDLSGLSRQLADLLADAMAATAGNASLTLSLAINYGGRDELVRACRSLLRRALASGLAPEQVDAALLASCLDSAGTPDPDLIVRTAGEMRLSNFLLWQAAYAEFYCTSRRWPEFDDKDFETALTSYTERTRKFGAVE